MKNSKRTYISCKDFTVSHEQFDLVWNEYDDVLITAPFPDNSKLSAYYKSENYISHTDGKRNLFEKFYQLVKSLMLRHKLKLIEKTNPEHKTLLDIGAGTGDFLSFLKKNNWEVNGVEPNEAARKLAQKKGVFLHDDISNLSESKKFDTITLWHVLEHIPQLDDFINKLKTHLKDNGTLIIAVPNFKSFDAKYYKEFWAAYDVPRHLWHFSQKGISRIFKEKGFKLLKSKPLWFDAFYVSMLSENYKSGKSNFIKGFFMGLKSNLKATSTKEYSSLIYFFQKSK